MLAPQFRQQPHFPWEVRLPLLPAVVSRERRRGRCWGRARPLAVMKIIQSVLQRRGPHALAV